MFFSSPVLHLYTPPNYEHNPIVGASSSIHGPQGIICDIWSSEYSKCQGSNNWSFIMRIIFRDFGRRKLQTTHDRDFKSSTRYHMVVPVCILSTILEGIEMDPSSPASSACSMNFPLSSFLAACCFWLLENNFLKVQPQQTVNLAYCAQFENGIQMCPFPACGS